MKKNKYFLAFPFSMFCSEDSDLLNEESKKFFIQLTTLFNENKITYYSAQERESWGQKYNSDEESTRFDYEAMKNSDVVICVPGNPYSGGTHIELGWASALNKKIILLLEKEVYYSPLVTGIKFMNDVTIYYYQNFFKDIIPIIEKIIEQQKEENYLKIIKKFLKDNGSKLIKYEKVYGGNHNSLFLVNNKYFIKFKDELSVKEEKMYFKTNKSYSPKLYYSSIKDCVLIYEILDAKDLEDASLIPNIIDIAYEYSKNHKITSKKGYGYYGIENTSWLEFLTQEVNVSKEYLKKYLNVKDFEMVDKALENIKKYKFKKRILHGDFGLHNTMISNNNNKLYFIDPEPVLGDWIYDFIFFCFSDSSILKLISFEEIICKIGEDREKIKSMMIIVMFNRLRRVLKYYSEDFEIYYDFWNKLGDIYND